jgi:hypothetical protein
VEEHRRERDRIAARAHGHQVLLGAQHEAGDRDLARALHHGAQQVVGANSRLVRIRHEVVRVVVVDRVDLLEVDERLDVDRARLLRIGRVELLVGEHDDLAALELVAARNLLPRHLYVLGSADAADLDPGHVLLVQLVEVHAEVPRGGHQLHGHVDEPEAERP